MDIRPLPASIAEFARAEMQRLDVPGLSAGVVHNGVFYAEGFGVTSIEHPLPVTPDTIFQIGSTSKTVTATVAMTLVEEGKLDIESPVRRYVPDFQLRDEAHAAAVTIRHLLTHHTGWPGDYFKDFGRGDDALPRYVESMARAPLNLPPGTTFSYCNSGFYVLAHVIERVSGERFADIVRDRIFAPLEMSLSGYHPEAVITHRTASGHVNTPNGTVVARPWQMAWNLNGGGGVNSTAVDQLRYAAFHLGDGTAPSGARILPEATLKRMQQTHAEAGSMCDTYGLGWMLLDVNGIRVVKHGGATNGFLSSFELAPDQGFGVAVLTNSFSGREARNTIADVCREHFLGVKGEIQFPDVPKPPVAEYLGEYQNNFRIFVRETGEGLELEVGPSRMPPRDGRAEPEADPPFALRFFGPDKTAVMSGSFRGERCEFIRGASGAVEWLRWDGRIARKL